MADISKLSNGTNIYDIKDAEARNSITNLANVATTGEYSDLLNTPSIPAAQVQSDWNATTGMGVILNKPTLATVATSGNYADLTNKPALKTVATSGDYADLSNKPTIPVVDQTYNASSANAQSGIAINSTGFLINENEDKTNGITIQGTTKNVNGIAIGKDSVITGTSDIALGKYAHASSDSIAIGVMPSSSNNSVAIGYGSMASNFSVAIGLGATATNTYSISIGTFGRYTPDAYSFNLGFGNNNKTYTLLDGNTGLIPDTRISTNIARVSDLPAAQVQSDWNATSGMGVILNKPTIPTVDQTYNALSTNAQSGVAVAEAISNVSSSAMIIIDYTA